MVDGFAEVWPVVALEGAGDLIGDARPGFVAVDAGRRLAFANAAAGALLPGAVWGAPLVLDPRLTERLARFADRAAPGEETRELLRLTEAGRPILRTVVFRRPIDGDDAVIVTIEGVRPDPSTAGVEASLAPFVATGGLVALFDAEGGVLGAVGDHTLVDGREAAIETILSEADEIAVIERRLDGDARELDLALVRFGDRPDAHRLLWIAPVDAAAEATAPETVPAEPAPVAPAAIEAVEIEPTGTEPAAPTPAVIETAVAPDDDEIPAEALPALAAALAPEAPAADETEIAPPAAAPVPGAEAEPATDLTDEDLFVAAPPLPLDLYGDAEDVDSDLAEAWSATVAPLATVEPAEADAVETDAAPAELTVATEDEAAAPIPVEAPVSPTPSARFAEERSEESEPENAPTFDAPPLPLAATATPLPLAVQPIEDVGEDAAGAPEETFVRAAVPDVALPAEPVEDEAHDHATEVAEAEATSKEATSAEDASSPVESAPSESAPPVPVAADGFRFTPPERAVKFVWQMDADHRFTLVSEEFAAVVGPAAADLVGRRWSEVAEDLDLDRDGTIAGALARRDTWSGRTLLWPIQGEALRIPVDLAALPAFARGRAFSGFRGFGTCRTDAPLPDPTGVGLRLAARAAVEAPAVADEPLALATPEPVAHEPVVQEPTVPEPVASEPVAPTPTEEPTVACVVEALAEPPLYPGDGESATFEAEHPIEPAFAGDIGDDPIFHPEAAIAPAEPAFVETPPAAPEIEDATPDVGPVTAPAEAPPSPPADALPTEPAPAETPVVAPTEPALAAVPAMSAEPVPPRAEARSSARVVALSGVARVSTDADHLSVPERQAFRQIAEALGARIEGEAEAPAPLATPARPRPAAGPLATPARGPAPVLDARLLDRLPVAVALLRDDTLIHANERFLSLLRYPDLDTLRAAGGVDALFAGSHVARRFDAAAGRITPLIAHDGTVVPCEARLATVPIEGGAAAMLTLIERPVPATSEAPADAAAEFDRERIAELQAIVDTATDGVLILDASGLVLSANTAAEVLFGVERRAMVGRPLTERLAPESRRSAMDYLDGLAANGVASVLNDGREVIGAVAPEGLIPLFMTIGRVSSGPVAKYCAVLRDITQWKKSEEELTSARRRAEEASIHKSDFLAKISHEIRTPLNAIIGFSELMLDERFGPVGNERYKDYLRDIHVSGSHIMSLVNDLLDLSKVEAGKMDLRFEAVPLADVVSECVAMMQPQANRERIIIRSSLPAGVPPVVADGRSMRQVVLNLLSNAIKFTPAGGQVIVSITAEDNGEVILRVRDTGYGMSDKELQTAMEPFRQLHTTRSRAGGTGLGLPLTKALTEANRAVFRIDSTVGQGTLVSIAFPVTRVLAS